MIEIPEAHEAEDELKARIFQALEGKDESLIISAIELAKTIQDDIFKRDVILEVISLSCYENNYYIKEKIHELLDSIGDTYITEPLNYTIDDYDYDDHY